MAKIEFIAMKSSLSRREFLKLAGLSALAGTTAGWLPGAKRRNSAKLVGRVAYDSVSVFDSPRLGANTLGYRFRDELLDIEYPLTPFSGPAYNPLWYHLADGYVHSGLIQPVSTQLNSVIEDIPETGKLFRVTVPSTRPYTYSSLEGWTPEQRHLLYYHSSHWVTAVVDGPNGALWYQITESWEGFQYYAEAAHLQPISDDEVSPISTDAPAGEKRIEISLRGQNLTAFEGSQVVLRAPISSGIANTGIGELPTETPTGSFRVFSKMPSRYMGANRLTDTLGDRYLPGVPWVMYFAEGGYALHGAYWHNNFGAPMSRGCVNIRPDIAQWLFRWTTPVAGPSDEEVPGQGTRVLIS
jgi:lipoprotein-anchoring transpeptidase ErfK/SrfK